MARRQIGDRVGAILSADENSVRLIGYGIYVGDRVPAEAGGWMAEALRSAGATNPAIQLDSGKFVYGCECWWGDEESVRKMIGDRTVTEVDLDAERVRREGV